MFRHKEAFKARATSLRAATAVSPPFNLITAVMIDSIFTEYATHISRNLNFILDHCIPVILFKCILYTAQKN
jgi:hypothetical protein